VVLGAASARGTQLVLHDSIGDPLRERMELWHASKHTSRVRTFVRDLLSCIYCTGWWLSVITLTVYLLATGQWSEAPLLVHGIEAFAIAAVQMLINRYDDHLGGS
jgi:hypothetical protein